MLGRIEGGNHPPMSGLERAADASFMAVGDGAAASPDAN